jgi:ATP-dependent Clp protease ATP-binding subunit ClpA
MLTNELEHALNDSFHWGRAERHEYLTVEHLLLAILDAPKVREILCACGADLHKLKEELKEHIDQATPRLEQSEETEVQPTLGFQRVLQRAVFHVQTSGRKNVGVANVLVAIFSEKESHAVLLLNHQHVGRLDVVRYISQGPPAERPSATPPLKEDGNAVYIASLDLIEGSALDSRSETSSPKLFVSYSHVDHQCLDRLLVHLRPLHRSNSVICWSDKSIRSGDKWRNEN